MSCGHSRHILAHPPSLCPRDLGMAPASPHPEGPSNLCPVRIALCFCWHSCTGCVVASPSRGSQRVKGRVCLGLACVRSRPARTRMASRLVRKRQETQLWYQWSFSKGGWVGGWTSLPGTPLNDCAGSPPEQRQDPGLALSRPYTPPPSEVSLGVSEWVASSRPLPPEWSCTRGVSARPFSIAGCP